MNDIFMVIAVVAILITLVLWNSGSKVTRTFYQAIENAQSYILADPAKALEEFYTQPNSPRKSELKSLGIDFVLQTVTNAEIRNAVQAVMAYFIAGAVRTVYRHQSNEDVFKMLDENPKIKKKFQETVSLTSTFIRGI